MTIPPPIPVFNEAVARAGIPDEMQHPGVRRWFVYRVRWEMLDTGEWHLKKLPYCIKSRKSGSNHSWDYNWDNPDGWSTFSEICDYIRSIDQTIAENNWKVWFRLWPGFPILEDVHMIFIDLDKCILPDGTLTPVARKYVDTMKRFSYLERSVSGTGLHLFTLYTGNRIFANNPEAGVEVYTNGRGALITGDQYG